MPGRCSTCDGTGLADSRSTFRKVIEDWVMPILIGLAVIRAFDSLTDELSRIADSLEAAKPKVVQPAPRGEEV